ncbi:MAG: hypothetical protein KJO55_10330 [Gammaproteobacteria bacterium]|nr:hypothetical protein [Gammaproteobacteria bacterium]
MPWTLLPETTDTDAELGRLRRSLARRDRRIAFLKKKLRSSRATAQAELAERADIIDGLERALLMHKPVVDESAERRIAELERRLAEMTTLVEILDDSDPYEHISTAG